VIFGNEIYMPTLNFMGDVMFGELLENYRRGLRATLEKKNIDPFEFAGPILAEADVNVINLESVFSDSSCLKKPFSEILISPEKYIGLLANHNINVVNTANNHALDHGRDAFLRSLELLESHGIIVIGYRRSGFFQEDPEIKEHGGLRIGFLGYNISNFPDSEKVGHVDRIKQVIERTRGSVDKLVLSIHWGEEYTNIPPPYVVEFGRELLEAGCDIVHGHHSHQVQGVARERGGIFAPSLGNFIFDQKVARNRITAILRVEIDESGALSHRHLPFYMNSLYQPEKAPEYETYLIDISEKLRKSFEESSTRNFAAEVEEKVKRGHRNNRIRMRVKMLAHFWDYLPYAGRILKMKLSKDRIFSVIQGVNEESAARRKPEE